jgi:hypothetical protein
LFRYPTRSGTAKSKQENEKKLEKSEKVLVSGVRLYEKRNVRYRLKNSYTMLFRIA